MSSFWNLSYPVSVRQKEWLTVSDLLGFESCPKQWALLNAIYDHGYEDPYPQRLSVAQFLGIVVHALIEEFAKFVSQSTVDPHASAREQISALFAKFSPLDRARECIRVKSSEIAVENPRYSSTVASSISVDAVLNRFRKILLSLPLDHMATISLRMSSPRSRRHDEDGISGARPSGFQQRNGFEVWIQSERIGLRGRADAILGGRIYEFKTGQASDRHLRQLQYYAFLHEEQFGDRPKALILVNDGTSSSEFVSYDVEQAKSLANEATASIKKIRNSDKVSDYEAIVSSSLCRYCPVRQFCDEYWSSGTTVEQRLTGDASSYFDDSSSRQLDVQMEADLSARENGSPFVAGSVDNSLRATVVVPSTLSHEMESGRFELRMLSASVRKSPNGIIVAETGATESFHRRISN